MIFSAIATLSAVSRRVIDSASAELAVTLAMKARGQRGSVRARTIDELRKRTAELEALRSREKERAALSLAVAAGGTPHRRGQCLVVDGGKGVALTSTPAVPPTLKQLGELKTAGILTDAEFETKKKELLAKL